MGDIPKLIYRCDKCNKIFDELNDLLIHQEKGKHKNIIQQEKNILKCKNCGDTFNILKDYIIHTQSRICIEEIE